MSTGSSAEKPPPNTDTTNAGAPDGAGRRPLREKLLWFAALWLGGLMATAALAYTLRALLGL